MCLKINTRSHSVLISIKTVALVTGQFTATTMSIAAGAGMDTDQQSAKRKAGDSPSKDRPPSAPKKDAYESRSGAGSTLMARPHSYDVVSGLLNARQLGYAGRMTMAGLAQMEQVKPAKLCHSWHHNVLPSAIFQKGQREDSVLATLPFGGDNPGPQALSGIQFLLTDPLASAPGIQRAAASNDDHQSTTGVVDNKLNPLGANPFTTGSTDVDEDFGFATTKYLNTLNYPLASYITPGVATHPPVAGTVSQTGHVGMREHNYVSGPSVMVDKLHVEVCVRTNDIIGSFATAAPDVVHNPGMNPVALFNKAFQSGNLDFRVLVLQNTNSYVERYACQPALWKDLFKHPMGNPMDGNVYQPHNHATNQPFFPITGWPTCNPIQLSGHAPSRGIYHNCFVGNQKRVDYGALAPPSNTETPQVPYIAPKVRDYMCAGVNTAAYRVLADEKFSLSISNPMSNNTLPTERTLTFDFPVNGLVDIGSDVGVGSALTAGSGIAAASLAVENMRRRSYGWDARNIYQNAPRILILCTVAGGRSSIFTKQFDAHGLQTPGISVSPNIDTHDMWTASTRGYTVYRDQPMANSSMRAPTPT